MEAVLPLPAWRFKEHWVCIFYEADWAGWAILLDSQRCTGEERTVRIFLELDLSGCATRRFRSIRRGGRIPRVQGRPTVFSD